MAGDLNLNEQSIVLPTQVNIADAENVVKSAGGHIMHHYGTRVLVSAGAENVEQTIQSQLHGAQVQTQSTQVSAAIHTSLEPIEQLGLEAFSLRQSSNYAEAKANRRHQGADWDSGVADTPSCHDAESDEAQAQGIIAQAATSTRLTGSVAVGLILVEGPTADLKFSSAERTKVVAEVQNGLTWLASQSPSGVSWHYDIKVVSLSVQPGADSLSRKEKEVLWRDPAMAKLGYGSGISGVSDYVEALRKRLKTTWGYCAFFTKYPLGHFAYAGRPRVVMDYRNDGWGPDNIDRVFAHETGHIFGAPDEYASSNCQCGGRYGYYKRPNSNCANCAPDGGVPCIMKSNSWEMCAHTPYHLGFPLVDQRYTGVWRSGSDAYYLWVNASWKSFRKKWEELAKKNLRLVDLKIKEEGKNRRYFGVWRHGKGGHYLWVNASWKSFRDKWQELAKKNLRLVDLEVTESNGKLFYSGVWLPGTDGYYLWVNASWDSFRKKWQELAKKNLRLVDIKIRRVNGKIRYFGVWRHGKGGHYLWVNASWKSFRDKWQELAKKNLRLVDIEITNFGGKRRYSGVWLPGTDGYYLWTNASWQSFRAKWEELAKKNLRLIDIDITAPNDAQSSLMSTGAMGEMTTGEITVDVGGFAESLGDDDVDFTPSQGDGGGQTDTLTAIPAVDDDGDGGGEFEAAPVPGNSDGDSDGDGGGLMGSDDIAIAPDQPDQAGDGGGEVTVAPSPENDVVGDDGDGGGSVHSH
ncbi:MAG: hypothetical protein AAF572_05920 [Cyanobacteria bacterium P01_B01_bin.77]